MIHLEGEQFADDHPQVRGIDVEPSEPDVAARGEFQVGKCGPEIECRDRSPGGANAEKRRCSQFECGIGELEFQIIGPADGQPVNLDRREEAVRFAGPVEG